MRLVDLDLPTWIRYEETLGKGGQAFVISAMDTRPKSQDSSECVGLVAVKCYERELLDDRRRRCIAREAKNQRQLKHHHVVGLREVRLTRKYLLIVLNLVKGGNLKALLKESTMSEDHARWYFQQIICGVEYCHRQGVLNRDISPDNILVSELAGAPGDNAGVGVRNAVLCDFGFSRHESSVEVNHSERPLSLVGKIGYVAPELVHRPSREKLSAEALKKCDIYSCGVCLFQMLLGLDRWPMESQRAENSSMEQHIQKWIHFLQGPFELVPGLESWPNDLSDSCKDLLNRLLQANPDNRISMAEIWDHPWFALHLKEDVREYNNVVTAEGYVNRHLGRMQSEEDIERRVFAAVDDFPAESGSWY